MVNSDAAWIAQTASGLRLDGQGIWTSSGGSELSYPQEGNARCYQIEDRSYWFKHRNDCIAALVKRFPPPGRILDIGGGNGYVTRRLLDEGFDATLLEPGPDGAWNGKVGRNIPEVICSTLEDAGIAPATLGAAGAFDVIEHVADDRGFVARIHELLAPNGMLYATLPAHAWLWSASDDYAQHHERYDRGMVASLLDDVGYELLHFSYFFGPLALPVLLLRALPSRLGLLRDDGNVLSHQAEHGTSGGAVVKLMEMLLRREARRIARGEALRLGTSCLFAARKMDRR